MSHHNKSLNEEIARTSRRQMDCTLPSMFGTLSLKESNLQDRLSRLPADVILTIFEHVIEGINLRVCLHSCIPKIGGLHNSGTCLNTAYHHLMLERRSTKEALEIYVVGYVKSQDCLTGLQELDVREPLFLSKRLGAIWHRALSVSSFESIAINVYDLPFLLPSSPNWLKTQLLRRGHLQMLTQANGNPQQAQCVPVSRFGDILPENILSQLDPTIPERIQRDKIEPTCWKLNDLPVEAVVLLSLRNCLAELTQRVMAELARARDPAVAPEDRRWLAVYYRGHRDYQRCSKKLTRTHSARPGMLYEFCHPVNSLLVWTRDRPERSRENRRVIGSLIVCDECVKV